MTEVGEIKVAQLIGYMNGGGVESVVMNYFRHIDRKKVRFDIIVFEGSTHVPEEEINALGGRVFYIPSYKHIFASRKAFKNILVEGGYDIVHSHLNALSVFYLSVAKKAGIKVRIAHSHSTSNPKERVRNILKNMLRPYSRKYATHYFACSEYAGRWLFGDKAYDDGLVTVINNAIDLGKFAFDGNKRAELREKFALEDKFVIGHVGRFMRQKNHAFLIDVFAEASKKRDDVRLLLLGDGPLTDEIKDKVRALSLEDKVVFAGNVPNASEYYSAMDCFVLPSLYEGLPVVGVEAQINGLKCYFSSEITKEIGLLDSTEFISLSEGVSGWAEKISSVNETDRVAGYKKMLGSIYDISSEAKKLEEKYSMFVGKIR